MYGNGQKVWALLLATLVLCAPISSVQTTSLTPPSVVILMCWDGVKQDHLYSLLSQGYLPNAAILADEGGLMNLSVGGHVTETTPGHVEMLTGYPPNVTGAYSNLEYSVIPVNLTVFERLEGWFGPGNITTVMLTGKPLIIEYIADTSQLEVIDWTMNASHPFYNARPSIDCLDLNRANASVVGGKALQYLEDLTGGRAFLFIHFREPDHAGHNFGENSAEYDAAIVECDRWLGTLVSALKSAGTYDRATIYVTTDHGFDEGGYGHSYAPEIWLFTNDASINASAVGYQQDIVPTIFAKFGIDPGSFSPTLPGKSLTSMTQPPQSGWVADPALPLLIAVALALAAFAILVRLRKKPRLIAALQDG